MKKSLVFALALMLVVAFASSAMAAQVLQDGQYLSTATGVYYNSSALQNIYKNNVSGQFKADGVTNYPYEIYIPNELNPGEYRIHSSYAKNTDACASCHSTHTAVGNTLLQWYSTYETCMACHDGTVTTTYNVVEGEYVSQNGLKVTAMGGAFGDEGSAFSSNHNVTGALQISAAPGGSTTPETVTLANGPQSRWTPTFGCESCHTPHGAGGNARILHPDTNFVASQAAEAVTTGYDVVGGVVYKGAIASGNETYLLKGYPYTISIENAGVEVPGAYIDNTAGYSVVMGGVAEKVYGTPSLKVTMSISNYLSYADPDEKEVVGHVYGMNFFCGACHTDYNTAAFTTEHSSDQSLGEYTKAHRHQVGVPPLYNDPANGNKNNLPQATMVLEGGNLECLTCHVAHGVNADFWKKTVGSTGTAYLADGDLEELAGSSALKRLPNMGTCEACHQKGASAEGYAVPALGSDNETQSDALIYDTAKLLAFNTNFANPTGAANATKDFFLDSRGAGLFNADLTVGSAKCGECHKAYYDVWKAGDHVNAGGNAVDIVKRYEPTGNIVFMDASQLNPKIVGYGTDLVYTKLTDTTATVVYGGGDLFNVTITGGNTITITNSITPSETATMKLSDMFIDGHAGEGFWYDKATAERYPLDRNFYMIGTSGEYVVTNRISPSLDMIELAEGVLEGTPAADTPSSCGLCHTPKADANFAAGVMEPGVGCEACHGPGQQHATAPTNVNMFNPATDFVAGGLASADAYEAQINLCLTCHSGSGTAHEAIAAKGAPGKNGYSIQKGATTGYKVATNAHYTQKLLTCTDCHDLHGSTRDAFIGYDKLETLCASCHGVIGTSATGTVSTYLATYGGVATEAGLPNRVGVTNNHGFPSNGLFNTTSYPTR